MRRDATRNTGASNTARGDKSAERKVVVRPDLDLPDGMPPDVMQHLKTVWCAGQQLRITRDGETPDNAGKGPARPRAPGKPGGFDKPRGARPAFGAKREFNDKPFGQGKPKPKPHRKGPSSE
jgi:ATP-dependent RNA helicase DeaD